MKFALLGADPDALELIGRLCQASEHELRVVYDVGDGIDAVRRLAPRVEIGDAPEALLARQEIDAVIVATSPDQVARERQLRTLVQGGLRLVVMLPICDSLTAYELEMIRSDSGAVLIPYSSGRGHPAIERLAELIREGERSAIGAVEQIVCERCLPDRQRETVIPQLCRDGHLIGRLIGDIESVSATGDGDNPYKNLSVGLNGARRPDGAMERCPERSRDARDDLAARPARQGHPGDAGRRSLAIHGGTRRTTRAILAGLGRAGAVVNELEGRSAGIGTWFDACRDLEIADHVAASLRRKRTIEIRRDGNPEENAFKGIMSAGGCLILLLCLVVILGFAVVEGFRMPLLTSPAEVVEMRDQETPRWHILLRLWPVYPLLAFLALQALLVVAKSGQKENHQDRDQ